MRRRVREAPIAERSEPEPPEAKPRPATTIKGGAMRRRVREAPIAERSEPEPPEAKPRPATTT
jgi:hypothetical protein